MLAEANWSRIYIALGYTDMRCGIDGLASKVKEYYHLNPFEKDVLYLFCGRKPDRIKGLVWEGNGFMLLYKRLEAGKFKWPRSKEEVNQITPKQLEWLLEGLSIYQKTSVQDVFPGEVL